MDHRRSQKGRAVKCPHYCWDCRVKKHRCRAVSLMFRPIKAPSDFSRHNGYFHSEHLASLITQWTSTEQGNHFKGIVTRWSSPITSQEKIPVGWEVGLFFKQLLQIREFISVFFFQDAVLSVPFDSSASLSPQKAQSWGYRGCARASCDTQNSTAS